MNYFCLMLPAARRRLLCLGQGTARFPFFAFLPHFCVRFSCGSLVSLLRYFIFASYAMSIVSALSWFRNPAHLPPLPDIIHDILPEVRIASEYSFSMRFVCE